MNGAEITATNPAAIPRHSPHQPGAGLHHQRIIRAPRHRQPRNPRRQQRHRNQ